MNPQFGPPIDLSDLPSYATADLRPRRAVFVGRVSTKDNQNPATSIPRQVSLAGQRLDPGEQFVAHFWDVESGMLPPELRGLGAQEMYDSLGVPVPRDGGLQDLVDRVEQLGVTHVLAERSDRLARAMLTSLTVEHELGKCGIEVVYANEPVGGTESGRLRTRRYGQVEAEIYRTTMLEMSMGGQIQHALGGWNHGVPPWPYTTVVDEHAPPPSTRFGSRPKRRLVPHEDPRRFAAAREMNRLRRVEHLRDGEIIAVMSAEPHRWPVEDLRHSLVRSLLANPKLTGYMVYNRKAQRTGREGCSRQNPLSEWVWSPHVTHEPVLSLQDWKDAQQVTALLRADRASSPLLRLRAAAGQLGHTVALVRENATHTIYRIGTRNIVVPDPIPDILVEQVIADLRNAV